MPNTLNADIKNFYDVSTPLWLDVWGEHMHHGWYGTEGKPAVSHREAQVELVERLLEWGEVQRPQRIIDAGCGVGGSARYLAHKYGANVTGVTLSSVQAERAAHYNRRANLQDKVEIRVQDMMTLGDTEQPNKDLIWSLESAEHIADKSGLVQMFYDLLQPGGKLLMVTWCVRAPQSELTDDEQKLLQKIYKNYHLPPMIPMSEYAEFAQQTGFKNIKTEDWTDEVAPFWKAVIKSAFSWKSVTGLLKAGAPALKGAWTMRYMTEGYKRGLLKFALLQGEK